MPRKSFVVACAMAVACALGCSASLREPTAADAARASARWPGTTVDELRQGRRLYAATCAGCHTLRDPAMLPPEGWEKEVGEMRGRKGVHLGERDAQLIVRYLAAMSMQSRSVASR